MNNHFIVPFGTPLWWLGVLTSVLLAGFFLLLAGLFFRNGKEKIFRFSLLGVLVLRFIISYTYLIVHDTFSIKESLPLHMCGLSEILCILYLAKPRQILFEFLILLSAFGALVSILTPEMTQGYSPYLFVDYYLAHTVLLVVPIYGVVILKQIPRSYAWVKIWLIANGLYILIGLFNWVIGSNYMYICTPPAVDNPLVIGDFPYHNIGFEILGLAVTFIMNFILRKLLRT